MIIVSNAFLQWGSLPSLKEKANNAVKWQTILNYCFLKCFFCSGAVYQVLGKKWLIKQYGRWLLYVWLHCLEFPTFISQKNSVFFNFQKEAKNSSVWCFASVFFCVCHSSGVYLCVCVYVCEICYLWVWQPTWCMYMMLCNDCFCKVYA